MKVRAERFRKAGSTASDVPIETSMICTYCSKKKYLSDNKNKDSETFVPSTKKFNKNMFLHGAIFSDWKLQLPFWKWKQKVYKSLSCGSIDKMLPEMFF